MTTDLHVINLPIATLRPYTRNARTHSPKQIAQIAASIREFGFNNPILIDRDGEIIAGHGRVAAAKKLVALDLFGRHVTRWACRVSIADAEHLVRDEAGGRPAPSPPAHAALRRGVRAAVLSGAKSAATSASVRSESVFALPSKSASASAAFLAFRSSIACSMPSSATRR